MPAINKNDIIQNGLFIDEINNSKKLIQELDKLDEVFRNISKNSKGLKEGLDLGKVDDLDQFLSLQKALNGQFEESVKLSKERISTQKKLNDQTALQKKNLEQLTADVANLKQQRSLLNKQEKQGLVTAREANAQRTKLNVEIKKSTTALNSAVKSVTTLTKAEKDLAIVQSKETGTIEKLEAKNRLLADSRKKLNLETKEGQRRLKQINSEIDRNNQALERNSDQLKKQRIGIGRYGKAIKANITRFVGWTAVIGLATRALRGASKLVVGFEKAQADLAGVLGKSRKEISALTKDAKKLGATTIFKPQEVSKLQKEFAKLGFATGQILNMTKATLDFAVATNTDLARAAEVVGNTLNGFQLGAEQTTRVVNVMNESFSRSALDTEKFSLAMGKVAPVANAANFSLEKTTATLGVLTSNGIKAETAGTGLRNILQIVAEKGLDLDEVLKKVNGSTDRVASATKIFGKQNAAVALTMATMQDESSELTEQLEKQGRTAEDVAREQMDTLSGSLKELSSAWDGFILGLESGDGAISRVARGFVIMTTNLVNFLTELNKTEKQKLDESLSESQKFAEQGAQNAIKAISDTLKKGNQELIDNDKKLFGQISETTKKIIKLRTEGLTDIQIKNEFINKRIRASEEDLAKKSEEIEKRKRELKEKQLNSFLEANKEATKRFGEFDKLESQKEKDRFLKFQKDRGIAIKNGYRSDLDSLIEFHAEQSSLINLQNENIKRDLKSASNEEIQIIIDANNGKLSQEALYEQERRKLQGISTENEEKENNKRVNNYQRYLDRKFDLDKRYQELHDELQRDSIELDSELRSQQLEIQLKQIEEQIESEKNLQIARINAGQGIEFERLDELFAKRKELTTASIDEETNLRLIKNTEVFNDELEKILKLRDERLKALNESGLEGRDENAFREEQKRIEDESVKLENISIANRDKRAEEIKINEQQKQKEKNDALLKDQSDFNDDVVEAEKKKQEELDKLREEEIDKDKEAAEKKKKAQKELFQTLEGIAKAFAEREQRRIDERIKNIDREIGVSRSRVDELRRNSAQNRQTIDSNIAFEERRQAQLEKQKQEQEKKKRQLELATTAVEVYSNKVSNNDPNPLLNTIKDITLLQSFVKNLPLFYSGTDTTVGAALGAPTLNTQRDGYVVRVDKSEKILNPYLSSLTGDMTTKEIAMAAYEKRSGVLGMSNVFDLSAQGNSVSNSISNYSQMLMISEISKQNEKINETNQKLDKLISKPTSSIFLDDTGAIPKIVQKTIEGNKTTNQNKYLR